MSIETVTGDAMNEKMLRNYLNDLVNKFFKILPMRENGETTLRVYMQSLREELLGCGALIVALDHDSLMVSLLSILEYLIDNPDEHRVIFRRQVFNCISIINKLKARYTASETDGENGSLG